ncbi:unnamed protein product [Cochlearia groenlandica]
MHLLRVERLSCYLIYSPPSVSEARDLIYSPPSVSEARDLRMIVPCSMGKSCLVVVVLVLRSQSVPSL